MSASKTALVWMCLVATGASQARAETLREALAWAYLNSPELRAEEAHLREIDEGVPQALAASRPTVQAFGSAGRVQENSTLRGLVTTPLPDGGASAISLPSSSYGVAVTLPLYRGGRTLAEFRQARQLVQAERAHLIGVEEQVLMQAIQAYADLQLAQRRFALAEQRCDALVKELEEANGRFAGGALVRTDLLLTRSAYDQSRADLADAQAELSSARLAYARYIGQEPGDLREDDLALSWPPDSDAAQDQAETQNPDVGSAASLVGAAEQHVKDARGAELPTLSAQAVAERELGAQFRGSDDRVEAVTLQLRVPLYSGGLNSSRLRAARDQLHEHDWELERMREDARLAAGKAFADLHAAETKLRSLTQEVDDDRLEAMGIATQVQGGEGTRKDLLDAQLRLYQAENSRLGALHDRLLAQGKLAAAIGSLTTSGLKLVVMPFDPAGHYRQVRFGPGQ